MSKQKLEGKEFLLQINFHEKNNFSLSEVNQMLKFINERELENISNRVSTLVSLLKGFEFIARKNKIFVQHNKVLIQYKEKMECITV
jgi:hypothetical protein